MIFRPFTRVAYLLSMAQKFNLAEMMSSDQNDPWGLSKSDCIWMVLKAGKELQVTHVSDAWQDMFAYKREEIVGRSCNFLHGPGTDHPAFKKMLAGANKGKDCGAPFIMYKKDGSCIVSFVQARTIAAEDSEHLVLKLSTSETITTKKLPSTNESWVLLSADSRLTILRTSNALCDLTGFEMCSLTSRSLRVLLGPFSIYYIIYLPPTLTSPCQQAQIRMRPPCTNPLPTVSKAADAAANVWQSLRFTPRAALLLHVRLGRRSVLPLRSALPHALGRAPLPLRSPRVPHLNIIPHLNIHQPHRDPLPSFS
jgi:PAS domain S-box-containing protein